MVGPFALRGRHESALERRVARRGERIHQRLADDRRRILEPGQLDPGRICIYDDAFLHVHDRVGRAGHEGLHLVAILVRGGERAGERAVEPGEMKLAFGHGPEPLPCLERDHVARAKLERPVQTVLGDRVAHEDDRDRSRRSHRAARARARHPRRRAGRRTRAGPCPASARHRRRPDRAPRRNAPGGLRYAGCC